MGSSFNFCSVAFFSDAGALRLPAQLFRSPRATEIVTFKGVDHLRFQGPSIRNLTFVFGRLEQIVQHVSADAVLTFTLPP
jgi:hypothetical protein